MKISVIKYELWNALAMCPNEQKTEQIKKLESRLNDSMSVGYMVKIDLMDQ
jgi:hypothetical protein